MIFHEPQLWWYPERPTRLEPTSPSRTPGNAVVLTSPTRRIRAAGPASCVTQSRAHVMESLFAEC